MKIEVTLFATLKERIGKRQIVIEISEPVSVFTLLTELSNQYPQIKNSSSNILVSINQEFATKDQIIAFGDEVALFPPVSGG
ncbi:MAG: molybdopterin synthase sulfur carrier subunit [Anaerolinea sp.]|nr:molybdopterin synthase sulfur carrier subunit [Anaerolinea sp.]